MLLSKKVTFLLLLVFIKEGYSFDLEDPEETGVLFRDNCVVDVDENNDGGEVKLIKITNFEGSLDIAILSGESAGLQPTLQAIDETSSYLMGVRLDYEKLSSPIIVLQISDETSVSLFTIKIKNLDDESPTLITSLCQMKENEVYSIDNTKCNFTVSDPDGWLNYMTFDITNNDANKIFEILYKEPEPDNITKTADVFLVLKNNITLDYEKVFLYNFDIEAKDSAGHSTIPVANVTTLVQVIDMPDMPPMWTFFSHGMKIVEKKSTEIQVSAIDGDRGINNEINYRIAIDDDKKDLIQIDVSSGKISVAPIDRDAGNDEVIFDVVAFEKVDETSNITDTITLLVQDIDDQIPKISIIDSNLPTSKEVVYSVDEGSTHILDKILTASDIDLAEDATYTIQLKNLGDIDYVSAFQLSSSDAYKKSTFGLTAIDPEKLDYEDPDWKIITMDLYTENILTPENNDQVTIIINLNDINDEFPIFEKDIYEVKVNETVAKGTIIASGIKATDLDQEDIEKGLPHAILGSLNKVLGIESLGGKVSTLVDNAFDYERQQQVDVLIQAVDAVNHTAITQLIINVVDVDNKPPVLKIAPMHLSINENLDNGTTFNISIEASDVDTDADLEFSINWDNSYATKHSVQLTKNEFQKYNGFLRLESLTSDTNNNIFAKLVINEIVPSNTPDYEIFDTFFFEVTVTDKATVVNDNSSSAIIVLSILNVNDNPPQFSDEAINAKHTVTENSLTGTFVSIIQATDLDGDLLTYTMKPYDESTPEWIAIDNTTGELHVSLQTDEIIDCDEPEKFNLKYNVSVFDGVFITNHTFVIDILDQNDNAPHLSSLEFYLEEDYGQNSTKGGSTFLLDVRDSDRDEPFNIVNCAFLLNYPDDDITNTFYVDDNKIIVRENVTIDRERISEYIFQFSCLDDPAHEGPISNPAFPPPQILLTILDLNDNIPEIPNTDLGKISESFTGSIRQQLVAVDPDEDNNGMVSFQLVDIKRFLDEEYTEEVEVASTLFAMTSDLDTKTATLIVEESLQDNFGYYQIIINTTDYGHPRLSKNNTVTLEVTKYNYEEPSFKFPIDKQTYEINLNTTLATGELVLSLGVAFGNVKVEEYKQNKYSIKFEMAEFQVNIFQIETVNDFEGKISVINAKNIKTDEPYNVIITASLDTKNIPVDGEAPYSKNCYITFTFV